MHELVETLKNKIEQTSLCLDDKQELLELFIEILDYSKRLWFAVGVIVGVIATILIKPITNIII